MLVIYLGNLKFWLKNQMVRTIPFGNPKKIWAVIFHSQFILFSLIIWMYFVACPSPTTRFPPR